MNTLEERTGQLIVMRCWCGVQHAVPHSLYDLQRRQAENGERQEDIYCPLGHVHVIAGPSKTVFLEREVERQKALVERAKVAAQRARDEAETSERRRRATVGQVTKLKRRAAAGVCPCCQRQFQDLRRHMGEKHPEFAKEE